ncbi:hypothetical protein JCM14076_03050 [Methylosoma difficile]
MKNGTSILKLLKATYAEKNRPRRITYFLKFLWDHRRMLIKAAFWFAWIIKKIFSWFEDQ